MSHLALLENHGQSFWLDSLSSPMCWTTAAPARMQTQRLAVANDMASADRLDDIQARTFCLLGDRECPEGSVWEAARFADDNGLERLLAIVEVSGLEQSDPAPCGHDISVLAGPIGRQVRVFRVGVTGKPRSSTPKELLELDRLSRTAIEREALAAAA